MFKWNPFLFVFVLVLAMMSSAAVAADPPGEGRSFLAMGEVLAANTAEDKTDVVDTPFPGEATAEGEPPSESVQAVKAEEAAVPPTAEAFEGPPLTLHCIEGYSGGLITPMAYFSNAGPKGGTCGMPVVAYTFMNLGSDRLQALTVSAVLFERVELGYSLMNLDTKAWWDDYRLHTFNVRLNVLPEDSFDLPLPAVTAGVHFKYCSSIDRLNEDAGGLYSFVGVKYSSGVDYTLTGTKTLPKLAFGRPVILTGGLRLSKAAQLGLLGFGGDYEATFEGSIAVRPLDRLSLAYEYRGKKNPLGTIEGMVLGEDDWHAFSASYLVNENTTITGIWGNFGDFDTAQARCVWGIQVKWEL